MAKHQAKSNTKSYSLSKCHKSLCYEQVTTRRRWIVSDLSKTRPRVRFKNILKIKYSRQQSYIDKFPPYSIERERNIYFI